MKHTSGHRLGESMPRTDDDSMARRMIALTTPLVGDLTVECETEIRDKGVCCGELGTRAVVRTGP